jgi:NAD(P)H dehydrogenase (quinone)
VKFRQEQFVPKKITETNMKIGVSGASGHLGRATIAQLVKRRGDHEIVAISRTPETITAPVLGRFGDYNQPESLVDAYAGLDRLLIIPSVERQPGKRGAQNVAAIDAAVKAGVRHIVLMSATGTRREEEPSTGASYWRGEQHLIAMAPAWTILRMNFYAEALLQLAQASLDRGVLTGLAENRAAFVARDDVAAAAAGILIGEGHAGAIYNATGPKALSGAERAAIIADIAGRPLVFLTITEEQLRAGLAQAGLPEPVINIVVGIQKNFTTGAFDIVTGDVERLGGRPPKPLRDVLAEALKSAST